MWRDDAAAQLIRARARFNRHNGGLWKRTPAAAMSLALKEAERGWLPTNNFVFPGRGRVVLFGPWPANYPINDRGAVMAPREMTRDDTKFLPVFT